MLRRGFFEWAGNTAVTQIDIPTEFSGPNTHQFNYEVFQPLLAICMRSKSETIKALAFEVTHIFAYLAASAKRLENLCVFNTDLSPMHEIFDQLFSQLGEQNLQLHEQSQSAARQVQNTKMRVLH